MSNLPEPAFRQTLRDIAATASSTRQALAQLVVHHAGSPDVVAPLAADWQEWPGLPGCYVYHVPHRLGEAGPYLAICDVAADVVSQGAHLDESRLIAVLEGLAVANGQSLATGQVLWIAPGQPLDWRAGANGFLAAIRYDVPPHDIDPDLLPIS